MSERYWQIVIGQSIDAVIFVQNYLQLALSRGTLSFIAMPTLLVRGRTVRSDAEDYSDILCQQIGRVVLSCVHVPEHSIRVATDDILLELSLRPEDRVDVEMLVYQSKLPGAHGGYYENGLLTGCRTPLNSAMKSSFDCASLPSLEKRQLGALVFERGSLRLQFDGPELILPASLDISTGGPGLPFGAPGTRDLLRSFIANTVTHVSRTEGRRIDLEFDDGRTLSLALRG
jgi:hypothetical protein